MRRAVSNAKRDGQNAKPEQLARLRMRNIVQNPRDHPLADDQHQRHKGSGLGQRDHHRRRNRADADADVASNLSHDLGLIANRHGGSAQKPGQWRDQHQRQDHHQILDDQPAHGDAALFGLHQLTVLHGAQKHHG